MALVSALPKSGKTELLAASVPAWSTKGYQIRWWSEESIDVWQQRLRAQGLGDIQGLTYYPVNGITLSQIKDQIVGDSKWPTFSGTQLLNMILPDLPEGEQFNPADYTVNILDTFRSIVASGYSEFDENANGAMNRAAMTVREIHRLIGGTTILVHHAPKHGDAELGAGGTALAGAADTLIGIAKTGDGDNALRKVTVTGRGTPERSFKWRFAGNVPAIDTGTPSSVMSRLREILTERGSLSTRELFDAWSEDATNRDTDFDAFRVKLDRSSDSHQGFHAEKKGPHKVWSMDEF
jgi:hypothetical protein